MPSWIVNYDKKKYFYYVGWSERQNERYHLSIGLATSKNNGNVFKKFPQNPIMDSSNIDPFSVSLPGILLENGLWRMWYTYFVRWEIFNGILEPFYHIRYAESKNGIDWERKGIVCIDFKSSNDGGSARPCVIKENNRYKMWYCHRKAKDYRENKENSYRIGYAESFDGISWIRKDEKAGIDVSENGWDSVMLAYPFVCTVNGKKYLFYNGNGFGKSGIGYAVLKE